MSHKLQSGIQRIETVVHNASKRLESALMRAVARVRIALSKESQQQFPDVAFCSCFGSAPMRSAGGIISILGHGARRSVLYYFSKYGEKEFL